MTHANIQCADGPARFSRVLFALCVVLSVFWWLGLVNDVKAAGCQLESHGLTVNEKGQVESSLTGQWQYQGGKVFYIFHPVPTPCDGPGCRNVPVPGFEMSLVQPPNERTISVANWIYVPTPVEPQLDGECGVDDRFALSPTLPGILRPPCAV